MLEFARFFNVKNCLTVMRKNDLTTEIDEVSSQKTAIVTTSGAVLGALIVKLRTDKGMIQGDLAAAINISPSTWSRIERGESGLSIEQLKNVAKVLGVAPWHILKLADDEEKALRNRGIYIDESFTSPKTLADAILAGKYTKEEVVIGKKTGGAAITGATATAGVVGSISGGLGLVSGIVGFGAIVPIAGPVLAAMFGVYKALHDKLEDEESIDSENRK